MPIGVHWAAGVVAMLLASAQFLLHRTHPKAHRIVGRVALTTAALTALGGFSYMILNGTVGGPAMTAPFCVYGAFMLVASFQTYRAARRKDFRQS